MADSDSKMSFREFTSDFIDRTGARLISSEGDPVRALELGTQARADALLYLLGVLQATIEAHPDHPISVSVIEENVRAGLTDELASLDRRIAARSTTSAFVDKETTTMFQLYAHQGGMSRIVGSNHETLTEAKLWAAEHLATDPNIQKITVMTAGGVGVATVERAQ